MEHSPARRGLGVGSVVKDTYTLTGLIGRGGMGEVFAATHNELGKRVAIKILHAELADADVLKRFKREARIAAELAHPNIVGVDDVGVSDGVPYLVLEYLAGESLAARIQRGRIPVDRTCTILRQVGSGLAAAHRANIVHRDLKPQNIFLVATERDGRADEVAKVLDFGISKVLGSSTVKTQESSLLGTPQYMAPEQALGHHSSVDERTDIFALGVIAYEMLSGVPPFIGASIPEVVFKVVYEQPVPLATAAPGTPPAVVAAVERAMAKKAEDRFPTVNEFIEALTGEALGRSLPPVATPTSSKDAFAATVDSGAGLAKAPAPLEPVSGHASTMISQRAPAPPDVAPVAPTVQAPSQRGLSQVVVPTVATPAPPKRAVWPWLAGAGGVIAVIGVAAAFALGRSSPSPAPAGSPVAARAEVPEAPAVPPPPVAQPTAPPTPGEVPLRVDGPGKVEAPAKVEAPSKAAPAKADPPPRKPEKKRPDPEEPVASDPLAPDNPIATYDELSASALAAMEKSEWRTALSIAQRLDRPEALPRHRQTAFYVAAMSLCSGLNNPAVGRPYVKMIRHRARRAEAAAACGAGGTKD